MSIIGNIGGQSGGGSLTKSILIVTAPTGSTVTVTKGDTTKTAMEKNGEWWFKNLENGEWTIRAELDGQNATEVFNITQFGVYRKPISYRMTPEFTYTGDYEIVQDDDTPIADFASWKGNWKIRFLTSGDFTITNMHGFMATGKVDIFLVGGGGHGGHNPSDGYAAGGGGGGGYTTTVKNVTLQENKTYQITIGAEASATRGFEQIASGGKSGGTGSNIGGDGGSGGGGDGVGGSDGGNGVGSKGGKGQGATTREFGDPSGKLYAGGGGRGYGWSSGGAYNGGAGGGAAGAPSDEKRATNAPANTGGGGGGGSNKANNGSSGGSGIVIIRNAREVAQ